ncbi:MAG: hypothetical protein GDA48_18205 [Hormoscilla sp. GM102CHS1]|nr:hypothetical protein [Hormoscilla sp. GM102CHS1]
MDTKTLAAVGYSYSEVKQNYGGIEQRWLVVESQKRREADLNNLEKKIKKELSVIERKLKDLSKQDFTCKPDASSDSIPLWYRWQDADGATANPSRLVVPVDIERIHTNQRITKKAMPPACKALGKFCTARDIRLPGWKAQLTTID